MRGDFGFEGFRKDAAHGVVVGLDLVADHGADGVDVRVDQLHRSVEALGRIVDPRHDDQGLLLDAERLPKRVRPRKMLRPL